MTSNSQIVRLTESHSLQVMHTPTSLDMCCTIIMYLFVTLAQDDTLSPTRLVHLIAKQTNGSKLTSCYYDVASTREFPS